MGSIYLIRHGIPALPYKGHRFLGRTDYPLSEEGRRALGELRGYFHEKDIARVYSGPLFRALETAREIFGSERRVEVVPALTEIEMGDWEGLTRTEVESKFPGEYELRGERMADYAPPGGESFRDVQKRSLAALRDIARGAGDAAIVTHAGVIRCVTCELRGIPLDDLFTVEVPYGGVTRIISEDDVMLLAR